MPTLLLHAEKVFQMDSRVLASLRRSKGLPFFPTTAKSFITWGRALPLFGRLLGSCQRSLDQRRRQGPKACVLRQPSTSWCRGKVSTHGKACLRFSYGSPKTQTILLNPHGDHPNRQALMTGNEQPGSCWSVGTMGNRVK